MGYYDTHVPNPLVKENVFSGIAPEDRDPPKYAEAKRLLPEPFWENHAPHIDCYWKAWELAFRNLRRPSPGSKFVSNFIDTAFNNCLFMWDSVFILMFGRYGSRAFNFQRTLDNFYLHQHTDGFICREIIERTGEDRFERFDPASTGPHLMPWSEWEYFLKGGIPMFQVYLIMSFR
jgi:hypothetical protein